MTDISYETLSQFGEMLEGIAPIIEDRALNSGRKTNLYHEPESVSFRLGRALGRLEGYRDYYYVTPETSLQRRFLSRGVRPCIRTIENEMEKLGQERGEQASKALREWFELAMSDIGVDYDTLD